MKSRQLLSGASNIVKLEFGYSAGGNVTQQTRTQGSTVNQTAYPSYDGVNRLKEVTEAGWTPQEKQVCDYDRWGNIWMSGGPVGLHSATAKSAAYYSSTTNRLVKRGPLSGVADLPAGTYDAVGNLVNHPDLGVFQYDAEGRITQANAGSPTITTTYEYDGDGRRVRKIVAGGGTTVFVYDAFGQLALDEGPGTVTPETVYLTADHLGSTRYRRGASETGEKCYDYFPFGEALTTSRPGCFAADGAPAASVGGEWMRVRFTGQWRDWETSLDYFVARSYSAAVGRFTSPDPELESAIPDLPGTWNRFGYSRNNSLRFVDPTGLKEVDAQACAENPACVSVSLNVIYDAKAAIHAKDGSVMPWVKKKIDAQIAKAKDQYGNIDVHFSVQDAQGKIVNKNGKWAVEGQMSPVAINIVVTDSNQMTQTPGKSRDDGLYALTLVNAFRSDSETLSHELAHHFTGDSRSDSSLGLNAIFDVMNDGARGMIASGLTGRVDLMWQAKFGLERNNRFYMGARAYSRRPAK